GREVSVCPVGVFTGAEGDHRIVWQRWHQMGHHRIHGGRTIMDVFSWQGSKVFLLLAHLGRPGFPFGFIRQIHAHPVTNKVSWFGQNLMGYWTGATTQCRIDCDQEVFLIPVLANRETIGDHVPGYGSNEDQEVGFLEEVVGWFRSPITHWSNI